MRMMVTLKLEKRMLPRDYRPWISALLFSALVRQGGDKLACQYLGEEGGGLFSFSVYLPKSRFGPQIVLESDYIKVIFSAYEESVFDEFFLALMGMQGHRAQMGDNGLCVCSVARILEKRVTQAIVHAHMLSPLVVRGGGGAEGECCGFLGVRDPGFDVRLRDSVARMLPKAGLDAGMLESLNVSTGEPGCKETHVLHKGVFYKSTLGNLCLSGEPALLNMLYHCGMGEMREDGFGLFELVG